MNLKQFKEFLEDCPFIVSIAPESLSDDIVCEEDEFYYYNMKSNQNFCIYEDENNLHIGICISAPKVWSHLSKKDTEKMIDFIIVQSQENDLLTKKVTKRAL